jgi:phospholipid transport system substrate-binding protein
MHGVLTASRHFMRNITLAVLWFVAAALPASHAFASSTDAARKFVDDVASRALAVIADNSLSKDKKEARLEKIFSSGVDIPWVGRFTLGSAWRVATEAQRRRYLKEYENFWVKHYASRFADLSGGDYKITGASEDEDDPGHYMVSMVMTSAEDHKDVEVDYRVHLTADHQLKIFDVVVEGVSMINTQRSEFASVITNNGLDYLIDQLAHRTLAVSGQNS